MNEQTYLNPSKLPFPFCPGCGHTVTLKALDTALVKLSLPPEKIVIVTDIGCIGLADQYFVTNAFHGLHGRALTYACGIKLANPELKVIAIMGDGGCGIGGNHLINTAKRNIGVTLLVCNNFNFGMTGGQHSVTTPKDAITTTTFSGNLETPLDICGMVMAGRPGFVARTTVFEKDLAELITKAISFEGFSMIDIWEICTAYFARSNKLNAKMMTDMMDSLGFKSGILVQNQREELSRLYREKMWKIGEEDAKKQQKKGITPKYKSNIAERKSIIIAGKAGQRVRSAATFLGTSAILSGLNATQKDDYPITVMTGHSIAEVIISPSRIDFTGISSPDIMLVLAEEGLKVVAGIIKTLPSSALVFSDEKLSLPETKAKVSSFPFTDEANKIDKNSMPILAISAMLSHTGILPLDAFLDACLSRAKAGEEVVRKAITQGAEL